MYWNVDRHPNAAPCFSEMLTIVSTLPKKNIQQNPSTGFFFQIPTAFTCGNHTLASFSSFNQQHAMPRCRKIQGGQGTSASKEQSIPARDWGHAFFGNHTQSLRVVSWIWNMWKDVDESKCGCQEKYSILYHYNMCGYYVYRISCIYMYGSMKLLSRFRFLDPILRSRPRSKWFV